MNSVILAPAIQGMLTDRSPHAEHPIYGSRPLLRGRFYQIAALASIPIGIHLVAGVAEPTTRIPMVVYAVTIALMFSVSAAYHRLAQSVLARFWMRRLDHSMILIHSAGGTTPIALFCVGGASGQILLAVSWGGAFLGAGLEITRLTAERDSASAVSGNVRGVPNRILSVSRSRGRPLPRSLTFVAGMVRPRPAAGSSGFGSRAQRSARVLVRGRRPRRRGDTPCAGLEPHHGEIAAGSTSLESPTHEGRQALRGPPAATSTTLRNRRVTRQSQAGTSGMVKSVVAPSELGRVSADRAVPAGVPAIRSRGGVRADTCCRLTPATTPSGVTAARRR
jgi:hypothetical protein